MKPQITIEQLRRAIEYFIIELKEIDDGDDQLLSQIGRGRLDACLDILDIIDNPEKYKHLWEDGE